MPEVLSCGTRKANKPHQCNYCGGIVKKGEIYDHATCKCEGNIYDWKTHEKCSYIANELWRSIDPDDGMTEEDFQEDCGYFCQHFVCPHCNQMVSETEECTEDQVYCLDKIYDLLQTHKIKKTDDWRNRWVIEERRFKA